MSKPRFITICQQAKQLLDLIPVEEETIKNLIDDYREAAEIFFAEGMYWELYDFDKKYPDATSSFNALKKVIDMYDTLPQDVYKIMEVDSFRPAVLFYCGRKAERAILNQQDVVEAMKGYQGEFMMDMLSGIKPKESDAPSPSGDDLPF
jgi:ferritin-like protein